MFIKRDQERKEYKKASPLLYAIPALLDYVETALVYIGLTAVGASIYQMCRGLTVVITAILSYYILKRK